MKTGILKNLSFRQTFLILTFFVFVLFLGFCLWRDWGGLYALWMTGFFFSVNGIFYGLSQPLRQISHTIEGYAEEKSEELPKIQLSLHASSDFKRLSHLLNAISDRTKQQSAETAREKHEKESILNSLMEGVLTVDEEGMIRYANPAFTKITNLTRRQLIGQQISSLLSSKKEPLSRYLSLLKLAAQQTNIVTDSISIEEGQKIFLDLIGIPHSLKGGATLIVQDQSSQHQVGEIGKEFIANASHELRTPITIIKGFAETLQDLPTISPTMLSEVIEKIVRNCHRMDALVKNLLTLADLEHVPESRFHSCDLVALTDNCVHLLRTLSPETTVAVAKSKDQIMVDAHPDLLELALMNLLENGIKYSHPPAHLTIRLHELSGNEMSLAVQDQGIGIPSQDIPHIFDRFYTVNKAHSRRLGGAGLGLSIVKTIIEKHEGSIGVISIPGKGTTFTMTLPKSRR